MDELDHVDRQFEIEALMDANSKAELIDLARAEGATFSKRGSKTEIARELVEARAVAERNDAKVESEEAEVADRAKAFEDAADAEDALDEPAPDPLAGKSLEERRVELEAARVADEEGAKAIHCRFTENEQTQELGGPLNASSDVPAFVKLPDPETSEAGPDLVIETVNSAGVAAILDEQRDARIAKVMAEPEPEEAEAEPEAYGRVPDVNTLDGGVVVIDGDSDTVPSGALYSSLHDDTDATTTVVVKADTVNSCGVVSASADDLEIMTATLAVHDAVKAYNVASHGGRVHAPVQRAAKMVARAALASLLNARRV